MSTLAFPVSESPSSYEMSNFPFACAYVTQPRNFFLPVFLRGGGVAGARSGESERAENMLGGASQIVSTIRMKCNGI
jgi:hypothetical protein